jgi:cell division cycle protein 20 (cofactor of APC complex)
LFNDSAPAKILAFKQAPPRPTNGFQSEHAVLFTQSKENAARLAAKVLRHIPQTPERILDAPELKQDFYLNLLAWSSRNIIAVALSETVRLLSLYLLNLLPWIRCHVAKLPSVRERVRGVCEVSP